MTQLYSALVRVLILRYLKNHPHLNETHIELKDLTNANFLYQLEINFMVCVNWHTLG